MKIQFLFFVLLMAITSTSFCQSVDKLDERNGFKTIKLNEALTMYKGKVQLFNKTPKVTVYTYVGNEPDLQKVFDVLLSDITLYFDNISNKLTMIILRSEYTRDEYSGNHFIKASKDWQSIGDNFTSLFGGSSFKKDESYLKNSLIQTWIGNKVMMDLTLDYYGAGKYSEILIRIANIAAITKSTENGF